MVAEDVEVAVSMLRDTTMLNKGSKRGSGVYIYTDVLMFGLDERAATANDIVCKRYDGKNSSHGKCRWLWRRTKCIIYRLLSLRSICWPLH